MIEFWITTAAIPLGLLMFVTYIRISNGGEWTTIGADISAILLAIDMAMLMQPTQFQKFIKVPLFAENVLYLGLALSALNIVSMFICLEYAEKSIRKSQELGGAAFPTLPVFAICLAATSVITVHGFCMMGTA